MKNIPRIHRQFLQSACLFLVAGLAWAPATLLAQDKGATKLLEFKTPGHHSQPVVASQPAAPKPMPCPECKDTWVTVTERTTKAVQPEIKHLVQKHLCAACSTRIQTEGHGKAKTDKAVHTCTMNNGACCTSK